MDEVYIPARTARSSAKKDGSYETQQCELRPVPASGSILGRRNITGPTTTKSGGDVKPSVVFGVYADRPDWRDLYTVEFVALAENRATTARRRSIA